MSTMSEMMAQIEKAMKVATAARAGFSMPDFSPAPVRRIRGVGSRLFSSGEGPVDRRCAEDHVLEELRQLRVREREGPQAEVGRLVSQ